MSIEVKARGWLKKPDGPFKSLKPHYCVLYEGKLEYFKQEGDAKPVRCLNLQGCSVSEASGKPRSFNLSGPNLKKTYLFQADTTEEMLQWMKKVESCIIPGSNVASPSKNSNGPAASASPSSTPSSPTSPPPQKAAAAVAASPTKAEEETEKPKSPEPTPAKKPEEAEKPKSPEPTPEKKPEEAEKPKSPEPAPIKKAEEPPAAAAAKVESNNEAVAELDNVEEEMVPGEIGAEHAEKNAKPFTFDHRKRYHKGAKYEQGLNDVKMALGSGSASSPFTDAKFPAADVSIFPNGNGNSRISISGDVKWMRPTDIGDKSKSLALFAEKPSAVGLKKGGLKDGYLVAALGSLCHPWKYSLLSTLIVEESHESGCYGVMFHCKGEWKTIIVDDLIPCQMVGEHWMPVFSQWSGDIREFWMCIIEKAWAKLHGSYEAIIGGYASDFLSYLLGGIPQCIVLNDPVQPKPTEQLWDRVKGWYKQDQGIREMFVLMSASMANAKENTPSPGDDHAFVVDKVVEYEGHRLLHLLNHSDDYQWTGEFSNNSGLWTATMKKAIGFEPHPTHFWITWRDFAKLFSCLTLCHGLTQFDPYKSHQKTINGRWVGGESAAGSDEDYLHFNPSFLLHNKSKNVNISLQIDCEKLDSNSCLHPMQLKVFKNSPDGVSLRNIKFNSGFHQRRGSLLVELEPEGAPYIILGCTTHAGIEAEFSIVVSSDGDLTIEPNAEHKPSVAEGRYIQARAIKQICAHCNKDVSPSQPSKYYGGCYWHDNVECYRCAGCKLPFSNPDKLLYDVGKVGDVWGGYCVGCWRSHVVSKCAQCKECLLPVPHKFSGVYFKVDTGEKVHEECHADWDARTAAICAWCNEAIRVVAGKFSGGEYNFGVGKKVHSECRDAYLIATADKCSFCKEPIHAIPGKFNGKYKLFEGGVKIHEECEQKWQISVSPVCDHCKEPLLKSDKYSGRIFTFDEGAKVHHECKEAYIAATSDLCIHCKEPICEVEGKFSGGFYSLQDKKVHAECLQAFKAAKK